MGAEIFHRLEMAGGEGTNGLRAISPVGEDSERGPIAEELMYQVVVQPEWGQKPGFAEVSRFLVA